MPLLAINPAYLSLPVDTDDTAGRVMLACNKDGFAADTVHVKASASLEVIEVDETVFRNQIDDTISLHIIAKISFTGDPMANLYLFETCIATGKSFVASAGKKTSTAFFA